MKEKDTKRHEAFSKRMTDILNCGALNLAMALGYRTGLFDVMDRIESPSTAADIAHKAKLDKRYVTEWLGVMVSGGIVDLSQGQNSEDLFLLPKEHADLVTHRAGNLNMGVYTQEIPLLTHCAMEPVFQGFQTGEGVEYDRYPRFQSFMAELANAKHREVLVAKFLPSISNNGLVERLKFGIRACDIGCAEGIAVILMAEAFPKSEFVGLDISEEVIEQARKAASDQNLDNVSFFRMDAADLRSRSEFSGSFDYVTAFDSIHDQTRPMDALTSVHNILKEGGLFSMVDIASSSRLLENKDHPMGSFLYTVSLMHCMPVGLMNGGAGLGMMWGKEKAVEMLKQAGFQNVQVVEIPDDPFNLHFLCRK
jgi:ubiquinone/menaquinone biosynthesis C-methylase UbiE